MDKYLSNELLGTKLPKLRVEAIEEEYQRLEAKGLAGSTRRQIHSILHTSLVMAQRRGHNTNNLASLEADKPKPSRTKATTLSESDVAAIEEVLDKSWLKARWHVGLALGLRPGEALGLEWRHIDFANSTIHIEQQIQQVNKETIIVSTPKTDAGNRLVPLPRYLAEMLTEHRPRQANELVISGADFWSPDKADHAWVFTSARRPGMPLTHDGDGSEWRKILARAKVTHVKRYSARHTATSFLIAHGVDVPTVAEILGHTDAGFTMKTYVHSIAERKKATGELLDRKVQNKVDALLEIDS